MVRRTGNIALLLIVPATLALSFEHVRTLAQVRTLQQVQELDRLLVRELETENADQKETLKGIRQSGKSGEQAIAERLIVPGRDIQQGETLR